MTSKVTLALAVTFPWIGLVLSQPAMAQITSDGSLSTTVNSVDGTNFVIENGDRAGNNLFHSFREFSVPTGGSATFNNAVDVQNIFSRVTGGTISNIDGLIRSNGRTNLFLLNPSGIVFGANAQLYLGGSFVGSTANRLRFADNTIFDMTSTTAPLLTVSTPAGLQFGNSSGNIQVNGRGNQEIVPTTNFGLAIAPAQTLALIGGAVTFDGGIATAAAGRLEIGGVAQGEVDLVPSPVGWQLNYGRVETFRDVQLLNRSSLWNPLSSAVGGIQVQGDRIALNNSQIAAVAGGNPAAGEFPGGNIFINAATSLELAGANPVYPFSSWIVNQVAPGASNAGGQIQVTTPRLSIQDGSRIQTLSQGSGAAGNIQVDADRIGINGTAAAAADPMQQDLFHSRITSDAIASGNGGNIRVSAQNITLTNGGQISTLVAPQATGGGGEMRVNVSGSLIARGANPLNSGTSSGLSSITTGTGEGGDILLSGDRLTLVNGGVVQSQVLGTGRGGDLMVRVSDTVTARGVSAILLGGIASHTFGSGNGGHINVVTDHLKLYGGANIASISASRSPGISITGAALTQWGDAGSLQINARQSLEIAGVNLSSFTNSGISSVTLTSGNTGDVDISTRRLEMREGAAIAVGVLFSLGQGLFTGEGTGNGGDVRINASEFIDEQGIALQIGLTSTIDTFTAGRGAAGDLVVRTPLLSVRDGAKLGSANSAAGRAGQVTVNADRILVSGTTDGFPAEIFATVRITEASVRQAFNIPAVPTGASGRLTLNADRITVADGGRISVQHQGVGNAGQLSLNTNTLMLEDQGRISATTASGAGGNIRFNVRDRIMLRDRSQISTTAKGEGNGGNILLNSSFLIGVNDSDIIAQAQAGRGGNIDITSESIVGIAPRPSLTAESDINASSQLGFNGSINIENPNVNPESGLIDLPTEVIDSSQQIAQTCDAAQTSQFIATGRGGLPDNPEQMMTGDRPWSDLREFSFETHALSQLSLPTPTASLVEASEFRRDPVTGRVELVAVQPVPVNVVANCSGMAQ